LYSTVNGGLGLPNLPESKLFSVDMGKGACCDCGKQAETQFVITTGKGEAKRLAVEAKRARAVGSKASDVCCGLCIARGIEKRGLFVTEVLKHSPIKLDRITFDGKCVDCGKSLPFGTYAHCHESGNAICVECGVIRGWTDKARAMATVKLMEIKEDIKALRKRYKIEAEGLHLLEQKVDLHKVTANYQAIELQITTTIAKIESYFHAMGSMASAEEKAVLDSLSKELPQLQDLLLEIKKEFDTRLFLMDRAERTHKMVQKVIEQASAEFEDEQEQRLSDGGHSEVPAQ